MEHVEQATAAPGEKRIVLWRCNRPIPPMVYERHEDLRDGRVTHTLVSPLCPLVWEHDGPCREDG